MTVKPKYYFNLDGNITDGEKEYSLYNIEDKVEGLSVSSSLKKRHVLYGRNSLLDLLNKLYEENKALKLQNGDLLYQIGEVGKNNKTCRECECFISEIKYCYMWDMEVEADDVVVACDQRKVKNTNEVMEND